MVDDPPSKAYFHRFTPMFINLEDQISGPNFIDH